MLNFRLTIRPADSLGADIYDEMYALYGRSHNLDRSNFEAKTKRKFSDIAIVRRRSTGAIVSFLGARAEDVLVDGQPIHAVYMGQAMTDPAARGSGVSLLAPLAFATRATLRSLKMPVVGWQDALTVRTFLLVARVADVYYPHPTLPMPAQMQALRDHLGRTHYGDAYDPERGVVAKAGRLVLEEDIRAEKLADEHIGFFARANPGYAKGDGLLQLFPLSVGICATTAVRLLRRAVSRSGSRWGRRPTTHS